ncbi:hypothetical protein JCM3770_004265 [Rhodotorula araucariae]
MSRPSGNDYLVTLGRNQDEANFVQADRFNRFEALLADGIQRVEQAINKASKQSQKRDRALKKKICQPRESALKAKNRKARLQNLRLHALKAAHRLPVPNLKGRLPPTPLPITSEAEVDPTDCTSTFSGPRHVTTGCPTRTPPVPYETEDEEDEEDDPDLWGVSEDEDAPPAEDVSLGGFAPTPPPRPPSPPRMQALPDAPPTTTVDPATPTAATALDKEVQNVVSGLTSFWGRVKKQGTAALQTAEKQYESARADLTPLLSQARANLDHLGEQTRAEIQRLSETPAAGPGQGVMIGADGMPVILDQVAPTKVDKGKGVDRSGDSHDAQQTPAAAASAFFASLAANPNVKDLSRNLSTLQTGVSRNLHQLQAQLSHLDLAEGQKVAEGYLHKGEHWFQEFSAEVGKLAKDAVKVVPPGGAPSGSSPDGGRASLDKSGAASALSRRELVLFKLRTDAALLLADPAGTEGYAAFDAARAALSAEDREAQIERELADGGEALAATRDELVPAQLDESAFWTRYFWRKQAIKDEEERRKKVLQIAEQSEDDFSWDMDEDDAASSAASPRLPSSGPAFAVAAASASLAAAIAPASLPDTSRAPARDAPAPSAAVAPTSHTEDSSPSSAPGPAPVPSTGSRTGSRAGSGSGPSSGASERSPRASSDGAGSYDIVHAESGCPSGDEGAKAAGAPSPGVLIEEEEDKVPGAGAERDEEDSDWE